jgi:hypothetical protein
MAELGTFSMALVAFCGAFAGFTALSLAMDRHHEDSFGRGREPGPRRRWLRLGGLLGLSASCAASLSLQGAAQGWVLWAGMLTAGAFAVVLMLTYAPRRIAVAGIVAGCIASAGALMAQLWG